MNDHDLLIQISSDIGYVKKSLDAGYDKFKDHEKRLMNEEQWTIRFKTGIAIICFLITVFGAVLITFIWK